MANEDPIQAAHAAIGAGAPGDRFQPNDFVSMVRAKAPVLAELLSHSSLVETARRYASHDAEAIANQGSFKRLSMRGVWLVFAGTLAGACLAGIAGVWDEPEGGDPLTLWRVVTFGLGAVALFTGAFAGIAMYQLQNGRYLRNWMSERAAAETERLTYFNRAVMRAVEQHPDDALLHLQTLEFFRRYLLDLEQDWYRSRVGRHRASYQKTLLFGAAGMFLVSIGSGVVGLLGTAYSGLLPFAGIGTIGAGLVAVSSRREELHQDDRNQERYRRTSMALSKIRERYSDVQAAVASGNTESLAKFVAAVHDQVSVEHREWIEDVEGSNAALEALQSALENPE